MLSLSEEAPDEVGFEGAPSWAHGVPFRQPPVTRVLNRRPECTSMQPTRDYSHVTGPGRRRCTGRYVQLRI